MMELGGDFPKGRYSLLLMDQLLDEPYYFELNKPFVIVGLEKYDAADCVIPLFSTMSLAADCVIPLFSTMSLADRLLRISYGWDCASLCRAPSCDGGTDLFTLTYQPRMERWSLVERCCDCLWSKFKDSEDEDDELASQPADSLSKVPAGPLAHRLVENGKIFEVSLKPQYWGSLTFKVVDMGEANASNESSDLVCQHHQVDGGSSDDEMPTLMTRLELLPRLPLRVIAGFLETGPSLESFCLTDPWSMVGILKGHVPWEEIKFFDSEAGTNTVLGILRCLRLVSPDTVKLLSLAGRHGWPKHEMAHKARNYELLLKMISSTLGTDGAAPVLFEFGTSGAKLEKLVINQPLLLDSDIWALHDFIASFKGIKCLHINFWLTASRVEAVIPRLWSYLANLRLPAKLNVQLELHSYKADNEEEEEVNCYQSNIISFTVGDGASLPVPFMNATAVCLDVIHRHQRPWQSSNSSRVVIPWVAYFPLLKRLTLRSAVRGSFLGLHLLERRLLMPNLETLELYMRMDDSMGFLLKRFARAAPLLKTVCWMGNPSASAARDQRCGFENALLAADDFKLLRALSVLRLVFTDEPFCPQEADAVKLFTKLEHIPNVSLGPFTTGCPNGLFLSQFESLQKAGKKTVSVTEGKPALSWAKYKHKAKALPFETGCWDEKDKKVYEVHVCDAEKQLLPSYAAAAVLTN